MSLMEKIKRFNEKCEKFSLSPVADFLDNLAMIFVSVCLFSTIGVLVALLIYNLIKYATRS